MPNKTLYIPDAELPLWNAAQRVARLHDVSVFQVVADALRQDLRRAAAEGPLQPADEWADVAADAA